MTEVVDFINTESKFTLKDGVLHFESKEQLKDEIEKIKTIAKGYRTFANFRIAILFFHGGLNLYPHK